VFGTRDIDNNIDRIEMFFSDLDGVSKIVFLQFTLIITFWCNNIQIKKINLLHNQRNILEPLVKNRIVTLFSPHYLFVTNRQLQYIVLFYSFSLRLFSFNDLNLRGTPRVRDFMPQKIQFLVSNLR